MKLQLIRFAVCGALTLLGTSSAIAAQPISFDVAGATVHTHGLTPGGSVVLVGAWRAPSGSGSIVTQTCRDGRAGTAGNLDVVFDSELPAGALVVAIDVATGRVETTAPADTNFVHVDLPEKRFKRDAQNEVENVFLPQLSALVIVVRPGEGVWSATSFDGGAGDADGKVDGRITVDPARLKPLAKSGEPPKKIRKQDVVLMVDASSRRFAMTEVAR